MNIFSNHAHVYPDKLAPTWKPILGTIDNLIRFMDEVGIDRTVVFAHDGGEEDFDTVKWIYEKSKNNDRIIPFGVINPNRKDAVVQLKRMYEHGFKGIKMHPAVHKFSVISKEAYKVYEMSEKYGLFIVFHTGPHWYKLSHYRPILFDQIGWDFPKLQFSLEHVGGRSFFYEAVGVIQNHFTYDDFGSLKDPKGRIYAGIANVFKKEHALWYLGKELVMELRSLIEARHIIFGLDFPHISVEDTKYAIECIKGLNIAKQDKEAILGGNLERILNL